MGLGLTGGADEYSDRFSRRGSEAIERITQGIESNREAQGAVNQEVEINQVDVRTGTWLQQVVGTCCGNSNGFAGLDVDDFTCSRSGSAAAACVKDMRATVIRDAQSAYRSFLAQTPPEMREFIAESCQGGKITGGCLSDLLTRNGREFLNNDRFFELALELAETYPDFDPYAVTDAASAWGGAVEVLGVLEANCERVQGNLDVSEMRYTRSDPGCHTQPDYSVVPTFFVGSSMPTGAGSLSDVGVDDGATFRSIDANASHAVHLGEMTSPLSLFEATCPDYISRYNSFNITGQYAVPCNAEHGSVMVADVYGRYIEEGLRDILVAQMAEEELQMTGANLVMAVQATSSLTGVTMDQFVADVQRSCSGDSASLAAAFQAGVREGQAALSSAPLSGDTLWPDIAGVVTQVEANSNAIRQLEEQLQARCGAYAYDIGAAFVGRTQENACMELQGHYSRLVQHRDEAFRHYPFLAQRLSGSDAPLWSQMAAEMRLSAERKAAIVQGANPNATEADPVRELYARALRERLNQTRERVQTVCANPQEEGLKNLQNPIIVGSFFDRDPGNRSAGWALCKAYADAQLSEQRADLAWMAVNIGSLFIPGIGITGQITSRSMAAAAVGLAGGNIAYTANHLSEIREDSIRDQSHYVAGVGEVSAYLRARAAQDSYMSEVLNLGGLEALNVAVTGLQVIPVFRGGSALLRLAEASGELNQTVGSVRASGRTFSRNYQPGRTIAYRSGDDWLTARVDEVLPDGIRVTDSQGNSRVLSADTSVTHRSSHVRAVRDTERTSARAAAELSGQARVAGNEVYIPSSTAPGSAAGRGPVVARVGQSVHATLSDGSRVTGTLRGTVRNGEEMRRLQVEVPGRGTIEVQDLSSVRVGRDTWVAPEALAEYRSVHSRWYDVFGAENAELLDKIIDIHTGRAVMRDPAALAEITRLVGQVDLSQGLPTRVLRGLSGRTSEFLARTRNRVSDELQQLSRGCTLRR